MDTNKKRLEFIDVAKGIGILLVVLGHLNSAEQPIRNFIYSFHMPLFFFLSGLFFKGNTDFKTFLKKSVKTLLVPYLIFVALDCIVYIIDNGFQTESVIFALKSRALSATGLRLRITNLPIWFLFALFYIRILYYFVHKNKIAEVTIALAGFVLVAVAKDFWYPPKCMYIVAIPCFVFYSAGYRLRIFVFKFGNMKPSFTGCILTVVFFGALWVLSNVNDCVNIYSYKYGNVILFYLNAFMGCFLTLYLSLIISKVKSAGAVIAYYGKNSIVVMLFHYYLCRIILPDLMSATGMSIYLYTYPVQILATILIFVIMIPFISLSNKQLKVIIGK